MVPELGHLAYEEDGGSFLSASGLQAYPRRQSSDETNREIDFAVRRLVNAAFDHAVRVLELNRAQLEAAAKRLLVEETLEEAQLGALFARLEKPGDRVPEAA